MRYGLQFHNYFGVVTESHVSRLIFFLDVRVTIVNECLRKNPNEVECIVCILRYNSALLLETENCNMIQ